VGDGVVRLAPIVAFSVGCSVVFPASEYEDGVLAGGGAGTTGGGGAGGAGAVGGEGGSGGAAPSCGPNAPISNIVESFDGGMAFDIVPFQACADLVEDALVVTPAGQGEFCWARTIAASRLACSSFSIRVDESLSPTLGAQTFLYLTDRDGGGSAELLLEGGGFQLSGVSFGDASYVPDRDRYWRVRAGVPDDAGVTPLAFDTSPDALDWLERGTGTSPIPLGNVEIQIGAGIYLEVGDVGRAKFDCVNQSCPP
jgi:hypothetical protein